MSIKGITRWNGKIVQAPLADFTDQWNVNVLGPMVLYRTGYELLKKATAPQFLVISSFIGAITTMYGSLDNGPYGSSKGKLKVCMSGPRY